MKKIFLAAITLGLFTFSSCDTAQNNTTESDATTETATVAEDTDAVETAADANDENLTGNSEDMAGFMVMAANSNMAEVNLGKLASQKATDPEVKKFGEMMANDHSSANTELKTLTGAKNVTLPASMGEDMQKHQEKLMNLSGADFDKEYINMMVEAHEKDVKNFKEASEDIKDAEVKGFANKTLPVLQAHLDQVRKIDARLEKK